MTDKKNDRIAHFRTKEEAHIIAIYKIEEAIDLLSRIRGHIRNTSTSWVDISNSLHQVKKEIAENYHKVYGDTEGPPTLTEIPE